jgi:predicted enzyme related to lactoylglutathione lyase
MFMGGIATNGIGQIAVYVDDLERATGFYRDVLGLQFLFAVPQGGMAFLNCGGVRVMLAKREASTHGTSIIYFKVSGIKEAHAKLLAAGAKEETRPHFVSKVGEKELWLSFFGDSENNIMGLMEEA